MKQTFWGAKYLYSCWCLLLAGSLLLSASGCATVYNPATDQEELIFISSAEEVQIGRAMSEQMIKKEHVLLNDPKKQLAAHRLGQRIVEVSDRRDIVYHFKILDHDDFNAFALPGGYIFIYRGLYERLSEEEVTAIFAHEVAHVAAKHSVKKMQSALGYNLLLSLVFLGLGEGNTALAQKMSLATNTVFDLLSRGYSREDELLADRLGLRYLQRAGYDPHALISALEFLKRERGPGGRVFEILSTHPRMQERIRKLQEEIEREPEAKPNF